MERYSRQTIFPRVGEVGQHRLLSSTALIAGCGALGAATAELLARAGVGTLRLADRDFIELNNLQRQSLYGERDVSDALPKAVAATQRIAQINSGVRTEAHVLDILPDNVSELVQGVDIILDGTDNWETRYLLNDAALSVGIPWIYAGVLGVMGVSFPVIPGETPCLRCVYADPPPLGGDTCETAGVLGPTVWMTASIQAMQALRILLGDPPPATMTTVDAWNGTIETLALGGRVQGCLACEQGVLEFLYAARPSSARLCGRESIQLLPHGNSRVDLEAVAGRLRPLGEVRVNEHLLKFSVNGHEITLFADGRAIVRGTEEESTARSLYARYIGG